MCIAVLFNAVREGFSSALISVSLKGQDLILLTSEHRRGVCSLQQRRCPVGAAGVVPIGLHGAEAGAEAGLQGPGSIKQFINSQKRVFTKQGPLNSLSIE